MPGTSAVAPEIIEEFAEYLPHIRRRWLQEQEARRLRQEEAWDAARGAADVLKQEFGARQVIAFGSLVHPGTFHPQSDIDLAVTGIAPARFFKAWAAAAARCPLELDLVDLADCSPRLREVILQEGVTL